MLKFFRSALLVTSSLLFVPAPVMAADQGLAEAQYYLGDLYKQGLGVSRDNEVAAKWLQLAAEQGY